MAACGAISTRNIATTVMKPNIPVIVIITLNHFDKFIFESLSNTTMILHVKKNIISTHRCIGHFISLHNELQRKQEGKNIWCHIVSTNMLQEKTQIQ